MADELWGELSRAKKPRRMAPVPTLILAILATGTSGIAFLVGQGLAYVSLIFGLLFFAFAARYYVATIAVLVTPGETTNGKGGNKELAPIQVEDFPWVSIHLALYNEERVVERLLTACDKIDYPNYEVVVVDDSDDGTVDLLKKWSERGDGKFKVIHRKDRSGFKGGALNEAIAAMDPRTEYVVVFDADFVPPPDILKKFLAYFVKEGNGKSQAKKRYTNGSLAAVQGYQWHTLNRGENWLTRGVSCEFSGNYMVDRTFQEVTGFLKMVAGSVYMVRSDILRTYKWSRSITEDWELTLRLYRDGYKVLYTPLVQAAAECPSNLGKLVRQRMRWAEGHTFNVKKYFVPVLSSRKLGFREKFEFLYFAPYYLQSAFLILGTLFWLTSDVVLGTKLPFWTAAFGWGLVFTNLFALPVMSATGLFLEKRARKDFPGLFSQFILIYALAPYQAYAALKGLLEPVEGSWVRTFKSGKVVGFPGRLEPRKVIKKMLPPSKGVPVTATKTATIVVFFGLSLILVTALAQGQIAGSSGFRPAYYFYNQAAPSGYLPFDGTPPGISFLMHPVVPSGQDAFVSVGSSQGSGPIFYSDPAPSDVQFPFGASVSAHIWVNATDASSGNLKFRIDIYDPATNSIRHIQGVGETEVFQLEPGVNLYQTSWGHMAQDKMLLKGEVLLVTFWCPDCKAEPVIIYNSPAHPSNIDFPIEVPENSLSAAGMALLAPGLAGLVIDFRASRRRSAEPGVQTDGLWGVNRTLIVAGAVIFLTLPLAMTFNDLLTSVAASTGLDRVVAPIVPYEAAAVGDLLRGFGLAAGNSGNAVWMAGESFVPVTALVDWNCAGWQGFVLLALTAIPGLPQVGSRRKKALVIAMGVAGIFAVNVLRILMVVLLGYYAGYPAALIFHNYGGTIMTLVWLVFFWFFVLNRFGRRTENEPETA